MNILNNLKILYVDDKDFIREDVIEYLNFYCKNVIEAKDGLEGYTLYKEHKPDIVITDSEMSKLNGYELLEKIRLECKKTRVIISTSLLEKEHLLKALDFGLVQYLENPLSEEKLLPVLKKCMLDTKNEESIFNIGKGFVFDILNETLFCNKKQIILTKKELVFLRLLIKNSLRTVKYEEFDAFIWSGLMSEDALRSVVKELRKKIFKTAIKNVSGIGYQISSESN